MASKLARAQRTDQFSTDGLRQRARVAHPPAQAGRQLDLHRLQHGPITCPECAPPLLPVTRGGCPVTGSITAKECDLLARWQAFFRRRAAQRAWRDGCVMIDTGRHAQNASEQKALRPIVPRSWASDVVTGASARWSEDEEHRELERRYWQHANAHWQQCDKRSRQWYRGLLKGNAAMATPSAYVLAFVYWRMTWQGCSNPYLLRRGHGLPLYGVAEWQAVQPAPDEDALDVELTRFSAALEASWTDWRDCIDLLGVTALEHRTWHLRAAPSSYVSLPRRQRKRSTGDFA